MMNINPNYMNNTLPINTAAQLPQAHGISSQPSASTSVHPHPFDTMTQEERQQTMQRLELEVQQMQYQVQLRQMYSELQCQQQQMKSLATICKTSNIYSAVSSSKKKKEEEEKKEKLEMPKTNFKQIVEIERRHSADLFNNSKKRKAREEDDSTNEPSTKNIKVSRAA